MLGDEFDRKVDSTCSVRCSGLEEAGDPPWGLRSLPKPYKCIGLGALSFPKPCEFIGFGALYVTKAYKFIRFWGHIWPDPDPGAPNPGTHKHTAEINALRIGARA